MEVKEPASCGIELDRLLSRRQISACGYGNKQFHRTDGYRTVQTLPGSQSKRRVGGGQVAIATPGRTIWGSRCRACSTLHRIKGDNAGADLLASHVKCVANATRGVGVTVKPNVQWYVKGGGAWGEARLRIVDVVFKGTRTASANPHQNGRMTASASGFCPKDGWSMSWSTQLSGLGGDDNLHQWRLTGSDDV